MHNRLIVRLLGLPLVWILSPPVVCKRRRSCHVRLFVVVVSFSLPPHVLARGLPLVAPTVPGAASYFLFAFHCLRSFAIDADETKAALEATTMLHHVFVLEHNQILEHSLGNDVADCVLLLLLFALLLNFNLNCLSLVLFSTFARLL